MPLNPRQLKFVDRYLATGNATQSYIDAGYTRDPEVARRNASRLLTNADVRAAVEAHRAKANADSGITAEWYAARVKLECEREGEGASHSARVSALKLAADLLGVGEKKPADDGKAKEAVPVELVTRLFALLGARPGGPGGAGDPAGQPAVGAEPRPPEPRVPE
jgi:phage terminase small subunit